MSRLAIAIAGGCSVLAIACGKPTVDGKSSQPGSAVVTTGPGSAAFVVSEPTTPPATTLDAAAPDDKTLRLDGAITDLDFGCWADNDCGIKVDDVWVWIIGGMRDDPTPQGQVIGFSIDGGPADEVRRKLLGKRVEVYAAKKPIYDARGYVRSYDAKQLTLLGDAGYYVRAK